MTRERQKEVLRYVINYFTKKNGNPQKILVQKAIYFLNYIGIETEFSFEGYQYGPFSMGIMNIAEELETSQEIKIDRTNYVADKKLVDKYLGNKDFETKLDVFFDEILEKNDSFDNVERAGTVMFVMANHDPEDTESIITGVERWKPGKYSEEDILATLASIKKARKRLE